jgi:transposase-like protein
MKILRCPNGDCQSSGKSIAGNVIRFGFYQTRWGKRYRYRCQTCQKTFCSNTATPYYRLQHRRATFDQVATLSVEGLNKSAIARVERIGWNTVDRWLEKASDCGRRFNDQEITGFRATELQADEIRTITQAKQQPTWIFAAIEVWSRLWSSTVVGSRSYQNTLALFLDIAERAN